MRTLTKDELNQLAGGFQNGEISEPFKPVILGLGLGILTSFCIAGENPFFDSLVAVTFISVAGIAYGFACEKTESYYSKF